MLSHDEEIAKSQEAIEPCEHPCKTKGCFEPCIGDKNTPIGKQGHLCAMHWYNITKYR